VELKVKVGDEVKVKVEVKDKLSHDFRQLLVGSTSPRRCGQTMGDCVLSARRRSRCLRTNPFLLALTGRRSSAMRLMSLSSMQPQSNSVTRHLRRSARSASAVRRSLSQFEVVGGLLSAFVIAPDRRSVALS